MKYYSIPFRPEKIIEGKVHERVNELDSIRQNIYLMIHSKWPEESATMKHFGCLLKKHYFSSPSKNEDFQKLKINIQKDVKTSLKKSIETNEQRLLDPIISVKFFSISTDDETGKENLGNNESKPFSYYLKINVNGKLRDFPDKIENIYSEVIPIS